MFPTKTIYDLKMDGKQPVASGAVEGLVWETSATNSFICYVAGAGVLLTQFLWQHYNGWLYWLTLSG